MKYLIFILIFVLTKPILSQKMASDYFDEAVEYCEKKDYQNALVNFQFIVDNYKRNDLYHLSYYNVAYLNFELKRNDTALVLFQNILKSDFNELEKTGGGIMADPYANYKHKSCELISDIFYEKGIYDSSLVYLTYADTVYKYNHFCGNEIASNIINYAVKYSKIYQKLNRNEKAIDLLLKFGFSDGLADNQPVLNELYKLLKGKKDLIINFEASVKNSYTKVIQTNKYSDTLCFFEFLNTEILVPFFQKTESIFYETEQSTNIEMIKQTKFYKLLKKLDEEQKNSPDNITE